MGSKSKRHQMPRVHKSPYAGYERHDLRALVGLLRVSELVHLRLSCVLLTSALIEHPSRRRTENKQCQRQNDEEHNPAHCCGHAHASEIEGFPVDEPIEKCSRCFREWNKSSHLEHLN